MRIIGHGITDVAFVEDWLKRRKRIWLLSPRSRITQAYLYPDPVFRHLRTPDAVSDGPPILIPPPTSIAPKATTSSGSPTPSPPVPRVRELSLTLLLLFPQYVSSKLRPSPFPPCLSPSRRSGDQASPTPSRRPSHAIPTRTHLLIPDQPPSFDRLAPLSDVPGGEGTTPHRFSAFHQTSCRAFCSQPTPVVGWVMDGVTTKGG
jgi:hypothetical protein